MPLLAQPPLGVERRGTAGAGRGHRLPVHVVLHVAGREHPVHVRRGRLPPRHEVAGLGLVVELVEEERGVRVVADGDEEAVRLEIALLTGDRVLEADAGDRRVAEHLGDDLVQHELDLLVRAGAVDHDRRRPELLTAVHEVDLAREARDEQRLLHRRVAATDDDDDLVAKERGIAGRAVGDAAALQAPLGLEPDLARGRARRDDHGLCAVLVVADPDAERALREVDPRDVVGDELGAEPLRLATEVLHHRRAEDAVGVARVVLHVGRDHQLAAPVEAFDHERLEVCARRIERGGVAGRPAADHDHVANVSHVLRMLPCFRLYPSL